MLAPPHPTLIPTVNIAPAKGWPAGATPVAADGLKVAAFASGLDHPRWLYVLPNGDVLVAETNRPPPPPDAETGGIRKWIMKQVMARAGATGRSADRISLLRDADGDGVAETRVVFLEGLHSPFGMALLGNEFFVANADAIEAVGYAAEVLTGFVNAAGEAHGRPVGVAINKRGALLVADDVGNTVWHVSAADGVR
jgi:glucose/arabinose dehydrogenase